jgi:hypothetical protein
VLVIDDIPPPDRAAVEAAFEEIVSELRSSDS